MQARFAGAEMNAQAVWHAEQLLGRLGGENRLWQCVAIREWDHKRMGSLKDGVIAEWR
jgi:hypothetical protein